MSDEDTGYTMIPLEKSMIYSSKVRRPAFHPRFSAVMCQDNGGGSSKLRSGYLG